MIALLLVLGCATSLPAVTLVPPAQADRAAIAATITAWNARQDLPDVDGDEAIAVLRVTDPPATGDYLQLCVGGGACSAIDDGCAGPFCGLFTEHTRLIVIRPGWSPAQRLTLVVHETIHHLGDLAGVGNDGQHVHPERWCDYSQGGCRGGSVEHAALRALRGGQ